MIPAYFEKPLFQTDSNYSKISRNRKTEANLLLYILLEYAKIPNLIPKSSPHFDYRAPTDRRNTHIILETIFVFDLWEQNE